MGICLDKKKIPADDGDDVGRVSPVKIPVVIITNQCSLKFNSNYYFRPIKRSRRI
jgi:hypothetical protein